MADLDNHVEDDLEGLKPNTPHTPGADDGSLQAALNVAQQLNQGMTPEQIVPAVAVGRNQVVDYLRSEFPTQPELADKVTDRGFAWSVETDSPNSDSTEPVVAGGGDLRFILKDTGEVYSFVTSLPSYREVFSAPDKQSFDEGLESLRNEGRFAVEPVAKLEPVEQVMDGSVE